MAGLLTQLMSKQQERRAELEEAARMIEQQCEDELVSFLCVSPAHQVSPGVSKCRQVSPSGVTKSFLDFCSVTRS